MVKCRTAAREVQWLSRNEAADAKNSIFRSSAFGTRSVAPDDQVQTVTMADVKTELTCPICLGIIRNTLAFMECLHRFCAECIQKYLRMGQNECPKCRKHCPSRRSLRPDKRFDSLINSLFPSTEELEKQENELLFSDERKQSREQFSRRMEKRLAKQLSKRNRTTRMSYDIKRALSDKSTGEETEEGVKSNKQEEENEIHMKFQLHPAPDSSTPIPALPNSNFRSQPALTMHGLSRYIKYALQSRGHSCARVTIKLKNIGVIPGDVTLGAVVEVLRAGKPNPVTILFQTHPS